MFLWCMLGILIPQKYIQKELCVKVKNLVRISIMMKLSFLCEKKILARLKQKTTFALTCFVTKMGGLFPFTFQIKNLRTQSICCL